MAPLASLHYLATVFLLISVGAGVVITLDVPAFWAFLAGIVWTIPLDAVSDRYLEWLEARETVEEVPSDA